MISLTDWIKNRSIEGVSMTTLKALLENKDENRYIKQFTLGVLMVKDKLLETTNEKIIKCIAFYYKPKNASKIKIPRTKNQFLKCLKIKETLGVPIDRMTNKNECDCKFCHINCLNLVSNGSLDIIINRVLKKEKKNL